MRCTSVVFSNDTLPAAVLPERSLRISRHASDVLAGMNNVAALRALAALVSGEVIHSQRLRVLRGLGWVEGACVTTSGQEALRAGAVDALAESAKSLGNYNVSREHGREAAAERHLRRSQTYLDLATLLEGRA